MKTGFLLRGSCSLSKSDVFLLFEDCCGVVVPHYLSALRSPSPQGKGFGMPIHPEGGSMILNKDRFWD